MLAKFPRPTALGVDQRAINCCADATRDSSEARNLIIATKTEAGGGNRTRIEATAVALDISPVSVGLDSENGPLDLPVSSKLATEKSATDRERSLCWAKLRRRARVWHLGRDGSQRGILIPSVCIVAPACTAADSEINARPTKSGNGCNDRHFER